MSFGGFLGIGADYYPLPWPILTYNPALGVAPPETRSRSASPRPPPPRLIASCGGRSVGARASWVGRRDSLKGAVGFSGYIGRGPEATRVRDATELTLDRVCAERNGKTAAPAAIRISQGGSACTVQVRVMGSIGRMHLAPGARRSASGGKPENICSF